MSLSSNQTTGPPAGTQLIPRAAGRCLLTDSQGKTFLLRGRDPHRPDEPDFWWTPGGGIDEGESAKQATSRELWEEIGLTDIELVGPVLVRSCVFPMAGIWYQGTETFFWGQAPAGFEPAPQQWETVEHDVIQELAWLSADTIRGLTDSVYPRCLADLLDHLNTLGAPEQPWIENDTKVG